MAWGGGYGGKGWGGQQAWGQQAWGQPAWGQPAWGAAPVERGIPNLSAALTATLAEIADEEPQVSAIVNKITIKVLKISDKYCKDKDKNTEAKSADKKGSSTEAKALVEEFVEHVMNSISGVCYDKEWFGKVNWTQPLLMIVLHTFKDAKMFGRTLKPKLITHIEDGYFKWQEEARITKAMGDAIVLCGIPEPYQKKANQALVKAYDEAHFLAPYGSTANASAELAVLQDFTKGWMTQFVSHAGNVLDNLTDPSKESQIATVAVLFQNLLDPNVACMPYEIATEITNKLGGLPASPWPFINEVSTQVFIDVDIAYASSGRPKKPEDKDNIYRRDDDGSVPIDEAKVASMLQERGLAKRNRNFVTADLIRDQLRAMGIEIHDDHRIWFVKGSRRLGQGLGQTQGALMMGASLGGYRGANMQANLGGFQQGQQGFQQQGFQQQLGGFSGFR